MIIAFISLTSLNKLNQKKVTFYSSKKAFLVIQ